MTAQGIQRFDDGARWPRLAMADGLRGLAALAVSWFHFTQGNPRFLDEGWLKSTGVYGWLGVPVFFVISGFVIPASMHARGYKVTRDGFRFLARRIVRLDPPYLAAGLTAWALWEISAATPWFLGEPPAFTPVQLVAHVGYLNGLLDLEWLNPAFWTLAIEFQFYLLVALVFPLIDDNRRVVALASVLLLSLASVVMRAPVFVVSHLALFCIGILGFQRYTGRLGTPLFLCALAVVAWLTFLTQGLAATLAAVVASVAIVWVREWRWGWALWLGGISYSLYLLHVPIGGRVINIGTRLPATLPVQVLVLTLAVIASLAAAWLLHRWVESPAQRWASAIRYPVTRHVDRLLDQRHAAVAPTGPIPLVE